MSSKKADSRKGRSAAEDSEDAEELLADAEVVFEKKEPGTLSSLVEGDDEGVESESAAGARAGGAYHGGDDDYDDSGELADEEVHDEEAAEEEDDGRSTMTAVPSGPDISRYQLAGHSDSIYCVAVSHNGELVATGSGDDTARLWSLRPGTGAAQLLFELRGHTESINTCAFNAADTMLATGALDGGIRVWSTATGACLAELDGPGSDVTFLSWHGKGDVLAAGSTDTTVWMWSVTPSGKTAVMQVFAGHEGEVTCGSWSSSGKTLLTGDSTGAVRMWNPKTGATQQLFAGKDWHEAAVNCIDVSASPDKPTMASASEDGSAKLVNCASGKTVLTLTHAWNKDSSVAKPAAGAGAGGAGGEDEEDAAEEQQASVECIALSEDETLLATGCSDGSLTVYDVGAGGAVRHRLRHPDTVIGLRWVSRAVPSNGITDSAALALKRQWAGKLAASCADGAVYVWDARDGKLAHRLTGHTGMVIDMAVAFTGALSSAGGSDDSGAAGSAAPLRPIVVTAGDDAVSRVFELGSS